MGPLELLNREYLAIICNKCQQGWTEASRKRSGQKTHWHSFMQICTSGRINHKEGGESIQCIYMTGLASSPPSWMWELWWTESNLLTNSPPRSTGSKINCPSLHSARPPEAAVWCPRPSLTGVEMYRAQSSHLFKSQGHAEEPSGNLAECWTRLSPL